MTDRLTKRALARAGRGISIDIDEGLWKMAYLAARAKHDEVDAWAETLASLPRVRKAARTVREWAQTAEFRQAIPKRFRLPFSFYSRASRYLDRLDIEIILDAMQDAESNREINVDDFSDYLAGQTKRPEPKFCLADWLHETYAWTQTVRDRADADSVASIDRILSVIDEERARLVEALPRGELL